MCIFVNIYVDNYLRRWKEVSIKKIKSLLNTKAKITWQNDVSLQRYSLQRIDTSEESEDEKMWQDEQDEQDFPDPLHIMQKSDS